MSRIAFIGLGNMGYPMAGHLATQGHDVRVFNRSPEKSQRWATQFRGSAARSISDAVRDAELVFCCVGRDEDLASIVNDKAGLAATLSAGSLVVDHSTVSATLARDIAQEFSANNIQFIDAPVSGGQQGAEQGQLTIMCGGDATAIDRARPFMEAYAKRITHMGPVGNGQLTKMVNQICVAGLIQALAEGLHFAQAASLDAEKVIEAIGQGAASSWQMLNRHQTMLADHYDHGFAVDWMRKDLGICQSEATSLGITLPVTTLVDRFYADVQMMGGGRWDTSSLLRRLQQHAASNGHQ